MRARHRDWRIGAVIAVTMVVSSCTASPPATADNATDRDVAVLTALLKDQCAEAGRKYRVVSDVPAAIVNLLALIESDWPDARALADQLERRSTRERWKWPRVSVCASARMTDAVSIEATFARDQRIPPGWDNFYSAYPGADGLVKFSRPAFASDGLTAVVYMESSCDVGCATGLFLKLNMTEAGWRIDGRETAWTP